MSSENTCAKSLAPRSVRISDIEVTGHRLLATTGAAGVRGLPTCTSCRHPLTAIAMIDSADRALGLGAFRDDLIQVLTCVHCDAALVSPIHYRRSRTGKSLVLVQQASGSPSPAPVSAVEFSRELAFTEFDVHSFEGPFHQLGGEPVWLAEPAPVHCTNCEDPMVFLLALDSDADAAIEFADQGMLYAFGCGRCLEYATFVQSVT